MIRHALLPSLLALMLLAPAAYAQTPAAGPRGRPAAQLRVAVRLMQLEIRRGVRTGRITPDEQSKLQAEMQGLRSQVQAIHQSGQPPTAEQREQIKNALAQVQQHIAEARKH